MHVLFIVVIIDVIMTSYMFSLGKATMFLCICNTFIGSNLNYKKVSCTLKIWGGVCHFENMLINQFPWVKFW